MFKVWGHSAYSAGFPVIAALVASVTPALAGLDTTVAFNLPAGDLARTLVTISRQGGIMISFPPEVVAGRQSAALQGSLTVREAIARVLAGTGLHMVPGAGGVTVVADTGAGSSAAAAGLGDVAAIDVTDQGGGSRFGDVGFQAGDAGDTVRIGGAAAKEVPLSVGVVTSNVIQSQAIVTATDAAQNVAGVNIQSSNPNQPTFTIRGFQSTTVTTDGQAVVGFGNGGFGQSPIDDVERVEVLKGPSSILTGTSGNGGSVNITTKQPTNTVIRNATVRYGSFNYKTFAFDFGGPIEGTEGLTYRFNISGNLTDENYAGYRDEHEYLISPTVKWEDGTTSVLAGVRFYDQNRGPIQYTFIPRNVSDINLDRPIIRVPIGTTQVNPNLHFRDTTIAVYSKQSHNFGDIFGANVVLNNSVRYETSSDDINGFSWLATRQSGAPSGTWRARQLYSPYEFRRLINQSDLTLTYDAGFARQTSKFGIDYSAIDVTQATNPGPIFNLNPLTGLPQQPLYRSVNPTISSTVSNSGTGIGYYYLEKFDTLDDRLHILGQVRYDENKYITRNTFAGTTTTQPFSTTGLSWTAGAAFDVTPYFTVYGNRAVGMIPQYSINVQTQQTAPPEERDQVEVGGRFFLLDKKLTLTMSYFDLAATNVAVCDAIRGCNFVQLIAGQNSKGYEFQMQGEIFPGFNVISSFSVIDSRNVGVQPQIKINAVPLLSGSIWGAYNVQDGPFRGLTMGLGARGNTDSFTSFDVSDKIKYRVPGFVTADAMIGYDVDKWNLQFKINNIFDKYYYNPSFSSTFVGIGRGRTFLFQAKYDFN